MPGNQTILLLTGPPGAGKTTVARLLAARAARGVHLETDKFWGFIAGGYVPPWLPEAHDQNTVVMDIVCNAATPTAVTLRIITEATKRHAVRSRFQAKAAAASARPRVPI